MNDEIKDLIPPKSFGHCRWCGKERTRLDYLMCPDCFRILKRIPSKAQVLINRPATKERLKAIGITVRSFAPELRKFLLDPASRFPPELSDKEHWEKIQDEGAEYINQEEIEDYLEYIGPNDPENNLVDGELARLIGIDVFLRFMLRVAVILGDLKINFTDIDDDYFRQLLKECLAETVDQGANLKVPAKAEQKHGLGMATRDSILKDRKR